MYPVASPAAPRIGAHVSVAGGILNAPGNAVEATCEAFQMWVSSPRAWRLPADAPDVDERFRQLVADARLGPVFVHAPYLVNFASTSDATVDSSVTVVAATLDKAAAIGAAGVVVHAGSHLGAGRTAGLARTRRAVMPLLDQLDRLADRLADRGDGAPDLLIEFTAGKANMLASRIEDMAELLDALDDHPRLKVCLDTCHAMCAGYDLHDPATATATADELDKLLPGRLGLVHANDSRDPCGATRDRHWHVGEGTIGDAGFAALLAHPVLAAVPWVTELPETNADHARNAARLRRLAVDGSSAGVRYGLS
jgi:deoxyribonuclease IV